MKKWLLIISILCFGYYFKKVDAITIPKEAIRLRVVANSDTDYDQDIKMQVSSNLQNRLYNLLKDTKSIKEARNKIKKNISYLDENVKETLDKTNAPYSYKLNYGKNYFPKKTYKGVTYEEGNYESLYVTLGKGEGKNWWCVLFPPLCIMEAEESTETEYRSFIKDIIDKYF